MEKRVLTVVEAPAGQTVLVRLYVTGITLVTVDGLAVTVAVLLPVTVYSSVAMIFTKTPQETAVGYGVPLARGTSSGRFPASTFARAGDSLFRRYGADDAGMKPSEAGIVVVVPVAVMVTPTVDGSTTVIVTVFVTAFVG